MAHKRGLKILVPGSNQSQPNRGILVTLLFLIALAGITLERTARAQQTTPAATLTKPLVSPVGLPEPEYQADFTAVIPNGHHLVFWANGRLVSFDGGLMVEPVAVYDKTGKWLFENPLAFSGALQVFSQDAEPTSSGTVVVAATALNADGAMADLIVEVDSDGIRRVIRTSPFSADKICVTSQGTVWAFGQELKEDRWEARQHYPALREYSFDKGELRSILDRATVRPAVGVPLHEDFLRCGADQLFLVSGATDQVVEYGLTTGSLTRRPLALPADGTYVTGAALTDSGEFYVSTLKPGPNSQAGVLQLQVNSAGQAQWSPVAAGPSRVKYFILLGSDGEDLVYALGLRSPTVFWSKAPRTEVTK